MAEEKRERESVERKEGAKTSRGGKDGAGGARRNGRERRWVIAREREECGEEVREKERASE